MKLGYLGPLGSHSHAAADAFLQQLQGFENARLTRLPLMTIQQILETVDEKACELGCVPVENALEGFVGEVLDGLALYFHQTHIVAEFVRPIQHALIRKYEFMEGISVIHSHPQAIGQCRQAIYALLGKNVTFVPASSTSEAVKALQTQDETHAALGTVSAAKQYGMEVLNDNVGGYQHNATRFLMVSAMPPAVLAPYFQHLSLRAMKTSFCIGLLENRPGVLLEMLKILSDATLNMSRIESRPTKKSLGEYLFYIDVDGVIPPGIEAKLQACASFYRVLGVYPSLGVLTSQSVLSA